MDRAPTDALVRAWDMQMPKEPSEWAYHWNYAECSTACPTPRDNCATLWMTCNNKDSLLEDIQDFFRMAETMLGKIRVTRVGEEGDLQISKGSVDLWTGSMYGQAQPEANVGRYAVFQATTEDGCALMVQACALASWGYMTFLFHDRVVRELDSQTTLVVTAGRGPDLDACKGLATRFELLHKKNADDEGREEEEVAVARCHLSYRDGSWDPSMGPTIEALAVHRDYRGQGHLPLLWFWVRRFIEDNFTMECLNNKAPLCHVMIKATQLINTEVDIHDGKSITDKDFLYNHVGFSVREQVGVMSSMMNQKRPMDEEAVLYIPLLTKEQVKERAEQRGIGEEVFNRDWPNQKGARHCNRCHKIALGLLKCTRCAQVYYCNRSCQKKDWKKHKLWCGKTRSEVHEELVDLGRRVKLEDGNWSTVYG
jgi:hypothetical protein